MHDPKRENHVSVCLDAVNKIRSIQTEFGIPKAICKLRDAHNLKSNITAFK